MAVAIKNGKEKRKSGDTGIVLLLLFAIVAMETPLKICGAPFLLGNQMSSLSVIPRTEEQAIALLEFLQQNPQYGADGGVGNATRQIQVNSEQVILVPREAASTLSNGLEEIGFRLDDSTNAYVYQLS